MILDYATRKQIGEARGKFAAMVATYGLGVFNDSFFRQSAMLMALAAARTAGEDDKQGWIMALFTVPYLLFASAAGWLADRYPKRRVVIGAKLMELAAMGFGAVGIFTGNWWFIGAMVFTMGWQSCLFSPALNGSIPELYPAQWVTRANGRLKVVVTAMILGGVAAAGVALKLKDPSWWGLPQGRVIVGCGAVSIAILGVLASLRVPHRPAANPSAPFPWDGPWETMRRLGEIGRDSLLSKVVAADVFIWFAGSMLVPVINKMAVDQFGYDEAMASAMVAVELVGVAIGGVLSGCLATGRRWYRVLAPGTVGMGLMLAAVPATEALPGVWTLPAIFVLLGLVGVGGGMVLVPCEAFVQVRPAERRRGAVIASVNFAVFAGILVSGPTADALNARFAPTLVLSLLGAAAMLMGLWLWRALRKEAGQ